jgi:cyclopropane-fatty-acyl-phospholipid synthase
VPINVSLRYAEAVGFEVRDVESLREHYALTFAIGLAAWSDIVIRRWPRWASRPTGSGRLFLPGSVYGFTSGAFNVYQALLVKPDRGRSGLPLTRSSWYRRITLAG